MRRPTRWCAGLLALLALTLALAQGERPYPALAAPAPAQPIAEGVRWPDVSLPVAVDLAELPPEWRELARTALAGWNAAGARSWYVEAPADGSVLNTVRFQVVDQLFTCGGQWQPAACTFPFVYQHAPWHLSHAVTQLHRERLRPDRPRRPLDVVDLPALLTHELGHGLGLGEAASPTAAMFSGALWSTPSADDVREIRALYGAAEGPRPAQAPVLQSPTDGAHASTRPALRWEPVPSAFGYYVQVAEASVYRFRSGFVDVSFGEYAADAAVEGAQYALPAALAPGAEYYWRVKARTPGGNSPWSAPARFAVAAGEAP